MINMASNRDLAKLESLRSMGEPVLFTQRVTHFTHRGERTELGLALTKIRLLLLKNGRIMREVELEELEAITLSEESNEMVLHVSQDADERFSAYEFRNELVEHILRCKKTKDCDQTAIYFVRDINLNRFVTSEDDLDAGTVLRPDSNLRKFLNVDSFKALVKAKAVEKQRMIEETKTIFPPNQRKVTVDDFELLQTLGKGAHGKVVLCQKKGERGVLYAMKILKKRKIIELKQLENAKAENWILQNANHNSLVSTKWVFQNEQKIYFVMEFMKGGDLFQHLKRNGRFAEQQVKFMAACIVLGIGHLHKNDYIYRDLKPENVLLTENGYAKLADFGLAKYLKKSDTTSSFCGTKEYLSPEVIQMKGYNRPTDWWALGTLVYELLYGVPPFYDSNYQKMYNNIVASPLKFKSTPVSDEAKSFMSALLQKDPTQRLGSQTDSLEIMSHPWFTDICWFDLINRKVEPPYCPAGSDAPWKSNFDQSSIRQKPTDSICYIDPYTHEEFRKDFEVFEDSTHKSSAFEALTFSELPTPGEPATPQALNSNKARFEAQFAQSQETSADYIDLSHQLKSSAGQAGSNMEIEEPESPGLGGAKGVIQGVSTNRFKGTNILDDVEDVHVFST